MKKNGTIFPWIAFAVVCIGIGWFGHQYVAEGVVWLANGMKPVAEKTAPFKKADEGEFCAKVITPARNPVTGDIQEFPTTCSVPKGWERIENDIPELDLEVQ